ncbi:MAG: hypothetical protein KDB14_27685, partial [Planctomycetales bacterium]|nr:hypothetical protein [Planctomycetales bacterium]
AMRFRRPGRAALRALRRAMDTMDTEIGDLGGNGDGVQLATQLLVDAAFGRSYAEHARQDSNL